MPWLLSTVGLPLAGGALIGLAATLLLGTNGQIAGISGILARVVAAPEPGETPGEVYPWRAAFLGGLLAMGALLAVVAPAAIGGSLLHGGPTIALAGGVVGLGTRLGGGCTSGHGVCGLSRGSVRSLVATLTFMGTGMLTATLLGWLGHGP